MSLVSRNPSVGTICLCPELCCPHLMQRPHFLHKKQAPKIMNGSGAEKDCADLSEAHVLLKIGRNKRGERLGPNQASTSLCSSW